MLTYAYFYGEFDPDCETLIETLSNETKVSFGGWHPATPTRNLTSKYEVNFRLFLAFLDSKVEFFLVKIA